MIRLESRSDTPGVHSVEIDIESGIIEAIDALRARGARRLGMVDSSYSARRGGVHEPSPRRGWFEEHVGEQLSGVVVGEESISGGGRAFSEPMERYPDTDAVLMFNDLLALGAVQNAHEIGIDVPGEVRIVGVDGRSGARRVRRRVRRVLLGTGGTLVPLTQRTEITANAGFPISELGSLPISATPLPAPCAEGASDGYRWRRPYWVRLRRKGFKFSGWISPDDRRR